MAYDLRVAASTKEVALRVRKYLEVTVIPLEKDAMSAPHGPTDEIRTHLQEAASQAGVFAPTAPIEYGGLGLDHRSSALVLEESGRSLLGPLGMNCAAPDEGNMAMLEKIATPEQRRQYLDPLCRGLIRSSFAMTEPSPGAGADPELLNTQAKQVGSDWIINGTKWFITGADGANFSIVMARTDVGATMFLVDDDNPGMRTERRLDTMDRTFSGGHGVVVFDDCAVPAESVLGEIGQGFQYAQVRLAPARLTHCMRWLGASRRAHETAVRYAADRPMFGSTLGDLGMAQQMIADNEIDIAASRLLILDAAGALDAGAPARKETSVAKTFVAEATFRIVDRSLQLCGGSGTLADLPIARIFDDLRPFRIYDGPSEVHRMSIAKRAIRQISANLLPGDWV